MKKSLKILLIVLITVEVIQLVLQIGAIAGLNTLFGVTVPFDSLPEGERYTFSVTKTDYEAELSEKDADKFRELLADCTFLVRPPLRISHAYARETLNITMPDGGTHSLTFLTAETVLGHEVGLVEYDGQEYFVDFWLYRYGRLLCAPYYEDYREWNRQNRD